jgi:hypothetical protein
MRLRNKAAVAAVTTTMLFSGLAATSAGAQQESAPAQICKAIDNTFPPDPNRPFPFEIQSDGGCASSVARGFPETYVLSGSAFASQCKFLEEAVPIEYPYAFYGNPNYVAENRADCIKLLTGFHYGELVPGPGA